MDRRLVAYWIATGLFCAGLGLSGLAYSFRLEAAAEGISALGYPAYFMSILAHPPCSARATSESVRSAGRVNIG